jgi:hypothetical protein
MPAAEVRDAAMSPVTELFAPTTQPNTPVTAGIDMGAGVGSNALMMAKSTERTSDILAKMLPFDTDGTIAIYAGRSFTGCRSFYSSLRSLDPSGDWRRSRFEQSKR